MKRIIGLILLLMILISPLTVAEATNVDAIQPSGNVYIVDVTDHDVPIIGTLPKYDAGPNTYVILNSKEYVDYQRYNPITGNVIEKEEVNDNDDNDIVTLPKEQEQSIEYQTTYDTINEEIFALINQVRQKNNLPVLTYNKNLQAAADLRAKESSIQFSHTRPDGSSCHSVITDDYFVVGENLLKADPELSTAAMMVDAWMNSKSHRDNILLQHFTETAIGVYIADDNVTYVAQLFKG